MVGEGLLLAISPATKCPEPLILTRAEGPKERIKLIDKETKPHHVYFQGEKPASPPLYEGEESKTKDARPID